jgi:L-alanine-DL-glutamate epimerase-like enolase superfamily enzyme
MQIAQHLLFAVPHGSYVECFADPERDLVWQAMWTTRPQAKDGWIEVSKAQGFGIELDAAMVERYRA